MWMFFIAGAFLLAAIAFIVKFLFDNKKAKKNAEQNLNSTADITVETGKKHMFGEKARKDLIIAFVCMMFCEVCILIGNHI